MNLKGVSYDVRLSMEFNWRPHFDPKMVHLEIEVIKNGMHCNDMRICGLSINRLMIAVEDALGLGLEAWLSP
jgi:hypothetical protein